MTATGTLLAILVLTSTPVWLPDDTGHMAVFTTEIQCLEHAQYLRNHTGQSAVCLPLPRR